MNYVLFPFIFLGLIILISSFFIVKQQTAAIIERFGRYPHRNDILGRPSTAEEVEFLTQPNSRF